MYQTFTLGYEDFEEEPGGKLRVRLPLLGNHQQVNAAVAFAALRTLHGAGVSFSRDAVARGFAGVEWPGRLEIVRRDPVVVVDGAHNVDSMSKLLQAMSDLFYGRKLIAVLGVSRDKDVKGMVTEMDVNEVNVLGPRIEKVIVTRSHHPRSAYPQDIAEAVRKRGLFAEVRENLNEALATAVGIARAGSRGDESDPVVLVTGSLFLAAEARQYFGLAPDLSEEDEDVKRKT
jgi:dihydrofolate synthase/folylpolyglutamate synthase